MKVSLAVLALLLFSFGNLTSGGRVLLVTVPIRSHIHYIASAGKELTKNGHEVHILLTTSAPHVIKDFQKLISPPLQMHHISAGREDTITNETNFVNDIKTAMYLTAVYKVPTSMCFRASSYLMNSICDSLLGDEDLFSILKNLDFDIALIDALPVMRCYYVLLYRLQVPYVSLTTQYEPWAYGIPSLPSTVPFALDHDFTDRMTFFERVRNTVSSILWYSAPLMWTMSGSYTSQYAPELPYMTPNQLAAESRLWFINTDVAIDYPRPVLPHVIEVGGLTTKPSTNPLPREYQAFMDNSGPDGVILISFGSFPGVPDLVDDLIYNAVLKLSSLKQHVIWKRAQYNLTAPYVITSKWIPQNEILAHPKTKIFITHGGNNGQFEALYHAVPMIAVPLYADQFYNARRAEYKGYSITKEGFYTTVDELLDATDEVRYNSSYKENILRGSEIYRSDPMNPRQRLVYWMEHVMEFGSDHLRSYSLQMPWYRLWMVDILIFLLLCLVVISLASYKLLHKVFQASYLYLSVKTTSTRVKQE